jgi:hypothetical protein
MAKLTEHEKAKRAKARNAERHHKWRLKEFDKHYAMFRSGLSGVTIYASDREFAAKLPAVERKVIARLAPIQKMIDAARSAAWEQEKRDQRAAWKKDHPVRTLRDLDASLVGPYNDAWAEWDQWLMKYNQARAA